MLVTQIQTAEVLEQTKVRLTVITSNVFAKNEESEALLVVLQYQLLVAVRDGSSWKLKMQQQLEFPGLRYCTKNILD